MDHRTPEEGTRSALLEHKFSLVLSQPISPPIIHSQPHAHYRDSQHESSINPITISVPGFGLASRVDPYSQDQARSTTERCVESDCNSGGSGCVGVRCEEGEQSGVACKDTCRGDDKTNVAGL